MNYLFDSSMLEKDYKDICGDDITNRPNNCHALTLVECNLQILDALKMDAKKADFCLKDVNKDIPKPATVITKYLLVLDKICRALCDSTRSGHD